MQMTNMKGDKKTKCDVCGGPVSFVTDDVIYGALSGHWPYRYLCDDERCGAHIGCHLNTDRPLGTMATEETRRARQAAHAIFDPLWKTGKMKRRQAYGWLAEKLHIDRALCHIGEFSVEQCKEVVRVCTELREEV